MNYKKNLENEKYLYIKKWNNPEFLDMLMENWDENNYKNEKVWGEKNRLEKYLELERLVNREKDIKNEISNKDKMENICENIVDNNSWSEIPPQPVKFQGIKFIVKIPDDKLIKNQDDELKYFHEVFTNLSSKKIIGYYEWCPEKGDFIIEFINNYEKNLTKRKGYDENKGLEIIDKVEKNTKKALDNEGKFIYTFNNDINYKRKVISMLKGCNLEECNPEAWIAKKPTKKAGTTLEHTKKWRDYKIGTNERYPTPKTDVILYNIHTKEEISISIKSGTARLTSADCYETNALFMCVYDNIRFYDIENNNLLGLKLKEIISLMTDLDKHKTQPGYNYTKLKKMIGNNDISDNLKLSINWVIKYEEMKKVVNKLWDEIRNDFPEYVEEVLFECMCGKYKFGDNIGRANYLIELESSNSTEIKEYYDLKENNNKNKKFLEKHGKGNVICMKSSKNVLWCRFL